MCHIGQLPFEDMRQFTQSGQFPMQRGDFVVIDREPFPHGHVCFGEKAIMPYLVAIDTMPKVAFAPLFVAWLGFDIHSKVALAAFITAKPWA